MAPKIASCDRLVYDVGMHKGEDTEFYLSRGCRVVGVEANPELVEYLQVKFRTEIRDGRVLLLNKAIAPACGRVCFTINSETLWGSVSERFIERNSKVRSEETRVVEVDAVPFADILHEYGMPYYLKIDIEGMDTLCIAALQDFRERPKYISVESEVTAAAAEFEAAFNELAQLWALGYRRFKYVDQAGLAKLSGTVLSSEGRQIQYAFREHSSGPFGEESPGPWEPIEATLKHARRLLRYQNAFGLGGRYSEGVVGKVGRRLRRVINKPPHSWYDLHARLG